jgi:hypothetical protein
MNKTNGNAALATKMKGIDTRIRKTSEPLEKKLKAPETKKITTSATRNEATTIRSTERSWVNLDTRAVLEQQMCNDMRRS